MQIEVSDKITIRWMDGKMYRFLCDNYTIKNPEYITRKILKKWLGDTPKTIRLFTMYNDDMATIPYGVLPELMEFVFNNYELNCLDIRVLLNKGKTADWSGESFTARPSQRVAVDEMKKWKCGILKAPCSAGKTIMGHILAQEIGMKTLWLTHTRDLLDQSKAVGISMLGKDRVGTITDGKAKIGSTITYATVQTLAKMDVSLYRDEWNCVIVDECHRCNTKDATARMSYVVNHIKAQYKYGLSATPETHDGYFQTILCNLGQIRHEISKEKLEDNGSIMPVTVKKIETRWVYPKESKKANGVIDFDKAVEFLRKDEDRNRLIVSLIKGRPTLILSNSVDHLVYIMNELSPEQQERACLISTKHDESLVTADKVLRKHTAKQRRICLDKMRNGELDIMLSTYQLAKEGLNIQRLEQVIMAFPAVDANIITQTVGRVARTCEGKSEAICYDLVDHPKYFDKKWGERRRLYVKNGNPVK